MMTGRGRADNYIPNSFFCVEKEPLTVNAASGKTELRIIVGILSFLIFIGIISCIIWLVCRRWFKNSKPKRNYESQVTDLHTTYQELDLSKMNMEDNYQSLTNRNLQLNNIVPQTTEIETTYQDLDVTKMNTEDNYQSLNVGVSSVDASESCDDCSYTDVKGERAEAIGE